MKKVVVKFFESPESIIRATLHGTALELEYDEAAGCYAGELKLPSGTDGRLSYTIRPQNPSSSCKAVVSNAKFVPAKRSGMPPGTETRIPYKGKVAVVGRRRVLVD